MPTRATVRQDIEGHLGYFPPFFEPAEATPGVLDNLWRQMLCGYVDNPLPLPFKEKLLAYLARYCRAPYCILVHSCGLRGLGWDAGQILALLRRPGPDGMRIEQAVEALAGVKPPLSGWPAGVPALEEAIFDCAVAVFLRKNGWGRCHEILRQVLGEPAYNHLMALLSYAKGCHLWAESHPELACAKEPRVLAYLEPMRRETPKLERFFRRYRRYVREERSGGRRRREPVVRTYLPSAMLLAPFPIMVYAEDGKVLQLNQAWTEVTGYTIRDIPTMSAWLRKGQGNAERFCGEDVAHLDGWDERIDEGEYTITRRDGATRVCEFSTVYLGRLPDGRRTVMRVGVDVSDRKRLEQALWETNRKVVNILEGITDGFFALDRQWRFLYLNPRAEAVAQESREHLIGKTFDEVFPQAMGCGVGGALQRAAMEKKTVHCRSGFVPGEGEYEFHIYPSAEGLSVYFREADAHGVDISEDM